jgi:hypothetical protein
MTTTINASTASGLVVTPDNSGTIELQSNGTTKATVSSAGFAAPGSVVQVQSYDFTGSVTTTSSAYTLLTASFTPKFAASKVLAMMTVTVERLGGGSGNYIFIDLKRNGTTISGSWANALGYQYNNNARCVSALNYLDSPATTSAISYTYVGDFNVSGNVAWQFYKLNLVLMEVAQ